MEFVTAYGPKRKVQLVTPEPTRTKQYMKDQCDINFILKQYMKTGVIAHQNLRQGEYGEFAAIDFHQAMNLVAEAREMFETVPAHIRKQFGNDPGAFLDFVLDEKNLPAMREMGLARPVEASETPPGTPSAGTPPTRQPAAGGEA